MPLENESYFKNQLKDLKILPVDDALVEMVQPLQILLNMNYGDIVTSSNLVPDKILNHISLLEDYMTKHYNQSADGHQSVIAIIDEYKKSLRSFIKNLKEGVPLPLLVDQDSNITCLLLEDGFQLVSYDQSTASFKKPNLNGSSVTTRVGQHFIKVGNRGLVRPGNEQAIYSLYSLLYPNSGPFISPTKFYLIKGLPILSSEYLTEDHQKQMIKSGKGIIGIDPDLKGKIEAETRKQITFLQDSPFIVGETLESTFKGDISIGFERMDHKSFSAHVIAGFLCVPSDYKSDNLMIESGGNTIVGIDNDHSLEFPHIRVMGSNIHVNLKNILLTLNGPMSGEIHQDIKKQFLHHHPNVLVLKWLLLLQDQQKKLTALVKSQGITLPHAADTLGLPLKFSTGWIRSLLSTLKKMKDVIHNNPTLTHQQLFDQISPVASIIYGEIQSPLWDSTHDCFLDNWMSQLCKPLEDFKKKNPKVGIEHFGTVTPSLNIQGALKELVDSISFSDFEDSPCAQAEYLDILFSNYCEGWELNKSWNDSHMSILDTLIRFGSTTALVNFTKLFKVENAQSLIHSCINANSANLCSQIDILVSHYNLNVEFIQHNNTPLDIAANNGDVNLFIKLVEHGAGKHSNSLSIGNFYYKLAYYKLYNYLFGFAPDSELLSFSDRPILLTQHTFHRTSNFSEEFIMKLVFFKKLSPDNQIYGEDIPSNIIQSLSTIDLETLVKSWLTDLEKIQINKQHMLPTNSLLNSNYLPFIEFIIERLVYLQYILKETNKTTHSSLLNKMNEKSNFKKKKSNRWSLLNEINNLIEDFPYLGFQGLLQNNKNLCIRYNCITPSISNSIVSIQLYDCKHAINIKNAINRLNLPNLECFIAINCNLGSSKFKALNLKLLYLKNINGDLDITQPPLLETCCLLYQKFLTFTLEFKKLVNLNIMVVETNLVDLCLNQLESLTIRSKYRIDIIKLFLPNCKNLKLKTWPNRIEGQVLHLENLVVKDKSQREEDVKNLKKISIKLVGGAEEYLEKFKKVFPHVQFIRSSDTIYSSIVVSKSKYQAPKEASKYYSPEFLQIKETDSNVYLPALGMIIQKLKENNHSNVNSQNK